MAYQIVIDQRALAGIQEAIDYYENKTKNLGIKFTDEIDLFLNALSKNPLFQIRYEKVRCIPLKKFPFMIHFTVDDLEKTVFVHAILHTSRSPILWGKK